MTQEAQFKACPFCGTNDGFHERADFSSDYWVCNNCLARGPLVEAEDAYSHIDGDALMSAKALAAWKTRASDNVVAELVEDARKLSQYEGHQVYCGHSKDDSKPCVCGYLAAHKRVRNTLNKLEASK